MRTHAKRPWIMLAAALVLLPALAYGIPAATLAGEVPPGTRVADVDLGGLDPRAAEAKLATDLAYLADGPLTLDFAGTEVRLRPGQLGLSLDTAATVATARDGALTPAGVARSLFGRRAVPPVVKVDDAKLSAAIAEEAKKVDQKPREGGVLYRGLEPVTVLPKAGRAVDRDAAAQAVRQAYLRAEGPITIPVKPVLPQADRATVEKLAATTAREAIAAPLTLTSGSRKATLTREQLAARLRFLSDGKGGFEPRFNAGKLTSDLGGRLVDEEHLPKDASFKIVKGRPRVVPAVPGKGLDEPALGQAVAAALAQGGSRTVEVPLKETAPKLTTEKAEKLGIKEKVSQFTTNYPCCAPRVTNIHVISDILDGHVVMPGETFSLNGVVGKRDKARGFVEAPMILNNRFVNDVGGGVSQFATTMFNAVFFGGFKDVQHRAHQYYISRYPAGRESTVSFPQPDFRWKNDSKYGVLVKASYTATSVTVQFWSTKRYDISSRTSGPYNHRSFETLSESGPECIPMPGAQGFDIDVWRIFKRDGKVLKEERFHTVYAPEPKLTCS
ncbi:VanW family protein [Nonomuraea soli]|uniref:Vancomycin resistance protein YoaR n=1 Tax=Nonomuraea soli TaxID=1032476 RepID=A0A7W0HN68_9ACTN|nr:VanW family protein [Nonomuraea soli]MBA2889510.1 vancomycin resistance protein YoaR [Nonomuraea soli]